MPAQKFRNPITAARGFKWDEVFKANADLSACQYRFVALGAVDGEVVAATGASNPMPIGVLQNAPTASQDAVVRLMGRSQLDVDATACTLGPGKLVTSSGCGGGLYAGASGIYFGRVVSGSVASATAGSLIVMLNSITPSGSLNQAS